MSVLMSVIFLLILEQAKGFELSTPTLARPLLRCARLSGYASRRSSKPFGARSLRVAEIRGVTPIYEHLLALLECGLHLPAEPRI
jgi:hypothetical protein